MAVKISQDKVARLEGTRLSLGRCPGASGALKLMKARQHVGSYSTSPTEKQAYLGQYLHGKQRGENSYRELSVLTIVEQ